MGKRVGREVRKSWWERIEGGIHDSHTEIQRDTEKDIQ